MDIQCSQWKANCFKHCKNDILSLQLVQRLVLVTSHKTNLKSDLQRLLKKISPQRLALLITHDLCVDLCFSDSPKKHKSLECITYYFLYALLTCSSDFFSIHKLKRENS